MNVTEIVEPLKDGITGNSTERLKTRPPAFSSTVNSSRSGCGTTYLGNCFQSRFMMLKFRGLK
jgi:hypothetical protein